MLGNRKAKKADILRVLDIANANFVHQLEHGSDTIICSETQGVRLNLSQMHRLVIARALLNQPKLLLVDDIMEGLDPHDRRLVRKAL